MTNSTPQVSVVVRTRNRPWYLRQALEGLAGQTFRSFEALVVNDGGEDVAGVLGELKGRVPYRYFHLQPGRGRCAAANHALAEARGKYVSYLDDDDFYYPDHLETLVTALEREDVDVAYTNAYEVIQTPRPGGEGYEEVSRAVKLDFEYNRGRFFRQSYIHLVTFMHAMHCIDRVGGFDESLDVLEDLDLYFRLSEDYPFLHVPRITAEYRIRDDNTNAITSLTREFQDTRRQICLKYIHLVLPELINYTDHKDAIVQDLMDRVQALEQRVKELEG